MKVRFDIPLHEQCGHGKLWTEFCRECRIAALQESLKWMEPRVKRDQAELESHFQALATPSAEEVGGA